MTDTSGANQGGVSYLNPAQTASEFTRQDFVIQQALLRVRTIALVKVTFVTTVSDVAAPGFVDIQPITNMVDGQGGNSTQHGIISHVPYVRIQSGTNGIIIDPVAGDIGLALICDRDTSNNRQNNGDLANPGSNRRFDFADAIYLGGIMGQTPTQYVRMLTGDNGGLQVADKNNNKITFSPDGFTVIDGGHNNTINSGATGISMTDSQGNTLFLNNSSGLALFDAFGHSFFSNNTGIAMSDGAGSSVNITSSTINMSAVSGATLTVGPTGIAGSDPIGGTSFNSFGGVLFVMGSLSVSGTIFASTDVQASGISLTGHVHFENGAGNFTNPPV